MRKISSLLYGLLIIDPSLVLTPPQISKPAYLVPFIDLTFSTQITRIANDSGLPPSPLTGTWGTDSRHVYSKQQPWNADGTLYMIQNPSSKGGSPSGMILDATTYAPKYAKCSSLYDYRWHPSINHAKEMINVTSSGTTLEWVDVTTCTRTRSWTLPITANYGIGSGEGNSSLDGRFVLIGNSTQVVVVDMDPQPPYAPYPSVRIGS